MIPSLARATSLRTLRVGARGFAGHWESMAQQIPAAKKDEFNAILSDMRKSKMKASEVARAIAPIDWAHFKEVLPGDQVDKIKAQFEATKYTDFSADASKAKAELKATLTPMVATIRAAIDGLNADAAGAKEQIAMLSETLTTFDTKLDDVLDRYPELDAKLETMIANNEWDPEMANEEGGADADSQRAALLKANWDESTMGPFDESVLNSALAELRAIDAESEIEIESRVFGNGVSLSDAPADLLAAAQEAFVKSGGQGELSLDALAAEAEASSTLTESELSETSEVALWGAMNEAEAAGDLHRANLLMDVILSKGAEGSLEAAGDDFLAAELAALSENVGSGVAAATIPASSEDLAGDAASLKAAAVAAEKAGQYRRAAEILMAAGVSTDATALKMKADIDAAL